MTTFTGKGIDLFQLVAVKGAIKLEALGLRHSSRRSIRALWKKQLGLKRNAADEQLLEKLEAKILEVRNSLQPGDIT